MNLRSLLSNTLLRNYLKIFSVDVLVKGSGIILLPIYLKLMTPEEFGLYGYLAAIVATFSLVFNLGMYAAQTKLYHDYDEPKLRAVMLGTLNITLLGFIGVLFAIILVFDIDYMAARFLVKTPIDYGRYRFPVLIGVLGAVYSTMLINFFLTSENLKKVQQFNIVRIILINVVVLSLLYFGRDMDGVIARLAGNNITELLIICFFSIFYFRKMTFSFDKKIAMHALGIGFPILISAILGIFINLSDRYFLEKLGTLKDLSVYNLALSVAGVIPFLFASFQNIWLPQFLKEKDIQANRARSRRMVMRLTGMMLVASVGIMILVQILLMLNIIDQGYKSIMPLLPIVLATSIVTALTTMFSNHLVYLNKLYLIILAGVPIACLGILLNLYLVPRLNIFGSAISALVLNLSFLTIYSVMSTYYYRKAIAKG
jgi:O-antigen/teichoic acid export membrane protein